MTQKQLTYMQENHAKYSKLCVYWLGPFLPWVFTADVETMKMFLRQPGGNLLAFCVYDNYNPSMFSLMIYAELCVHR